MIGRMGEHYPWRDGASLTQVINTNRELLVRAGVIEDGPGYTEEEIKAWCERLKEPPPAEAIELYRAARPQQIREDWPSTEVALFRLEDDAVRWYSLMDELPHPIDLILWPDEMVEPEDKRDWRKAHGFMLGGTPFFDRLFILRGHARAADGCILMTDHEGGDKMTIAARSLAEYMARLCYLGNDLISVPGARNEMPYEKVKLFVREYDELNPHSYADWLEWAARREMPANESSGYMHWDHKQRRLVPIAEAGEVPWIEMNRATRAHLESLGSAKGLTKLWIGESVIGDTSLFARLSVLEELYLRDCGELNAAPLNRASSLNEVHFLRCTVRGISELANIKTLQRLRLEECVFDPAELETFKKARPEVELE